MSSSPNRMGEAVLATEDLGVAMSAKEAAVVVAVWRKDLLVDRLFLLLLAATWG